MQVVTRFTTDPTLVGISKFTFDALKFTVQVGGKLLEPVTTLDINADLSPMVMAQRISWAEMYFSVKD